MMFDGTVLVVGATGETGTRLVNCLYRHGIKMRALARTQEKAELIHAEAGEVVIGELGANMPPASLFRGIGAVISVMGARAVGNPALSDLVENQATANMVDAAKAAGVRHFVLCTSLGTETPEAIPFLADVLRAKRKGELHLINSGLPYTIVRPGGLVNDPPTNEVRIGLGGINGRITRGDVAEVLVQALLQPAAHNKVVEIVNQAGAGAANRPGLFSF